ncbi:MAG TPA: hypothetical protein VK184_17400 [Nostocaceae cyanobacterium]|nr:hypothetical protein [Nostocaceae cyanobacterium]
MTLTNYKTMNLDELRRYVLAHREDNEAFHAYIDRKKAEGRITTINPSDENWQEKVTAAINYSENSIRWSCDSTEKYQKQSQIITEWWKNLDHKFVRKYHVENIETTSIAEWQPDKIDLPSKFKISEPSLEIGLSTTLLKYKDAENSPHEIEAYAIDLDLSKQNLFIWVNGLPGVMIFCLEPV